MTYSNIQKRLKQLVPVLNEAVTLILAIYLGNPAASYAAKAGEGCEESLSAIRLISVRTYGAV
jgi:hypothetical protein